MRTLIAGVALLILTIFLGWHVAPCLRMGGRTAAMVERGEAREALDWLDRIAQRKPCLCAEGIRRMRPQTALSGVEQARRSGRFQEARALLTEADDGPRTAELRRRLPEAHLERALWMADIGRLDAALAQLSEIVEIYEGERVQERARRERDVLRFRRMQQWIAAGRNEDALEETLTLVWNPNLPAVLSAQLRRQAPLLLEQIVKERIRRREYAAAFAKLDAVAMRGLPYGDFTELAVWVDYEVFGVRLQPVRLPASIALRRGVSAAVGAVRVRVENRTGSQLKLLYRGRKNHDVAVEPGAEQRLELPAGDYILGVYSPDNPGLLALRSRVVLAPGEYSQVFAPEDSWEAFAWLPQQ